ncbi:hypothetical protein N566_19160 [Streptomycetaceae bacterium MP113-05]|nr:hypothetical protein N566_19160 [Streptomycetaceae bacterium MP113-05]
MRIRAAHAFADRVSERWQPDAVVAGARRIPALEAAPTARLFCALVHAGTCPAFPLTPPAPSTGSSRALSTRPPWAG